jgi:hypothetical protein
VSPLNVFNPELAEWLKWKECLPSKCEALSSSPRAVKKKKKKTIKSPLTHTVHTISPEREVLFLHCKDEAKPGMVVHACKSSSREVEAGGS